MQPLGYRPHFIPYEINPYEQRFVPFLPLLGGLAGGLAGGLLAGSLLTRPPYGYYPSPFYGAYGSPYGSPYSSPYGSPYGGIPYY